MTPRDVAFDTKWSFGACIQAYRFGFAPLPGYRSGLLRITRINGLIRCELRPLERVPAGLKGDEHYVWWGDKDHGKEAIKSSPVLPAIKTVKKPFTVVLNEQGEIVSPSCGGRTN